MRGNDALFFPFIVFSPELLKTTQTTPKGQNDWGDKGFHVIYAAQNLHRKLHQLHPKEGRFRVYALLM